MLKIANEEIKKHPNLQNRSLNVCIEEGKFFKSNQRRIVEDSVKDALGHVWHKSTSVDTDYFWKLIPDTGKKKKNRK